MITLTSTSGLQEAHGIITGVKVDERKSDHSGDEDEDEKSPGLETWVYVVIGIAVFAVVVIVIGSIAVVTRRRRYPRHRDELVSEMLIRCGDCF